MGYHIFPTILLITLVFPIMPALAAGADGLSTPVAPAIELLESMPKANVAPALVGPSLPSAVPSKDCSFSSTQITSNSADYGYRHFYSTRSAFNADSTRLVLQEGPEGKTLGDKQVLMDLYGNVIETLPINRDVIWARNDADVMYGVRESGNGSYELIQYNISTKSVNVVYSSAEYFEIGLRKGSISYDDRYTVINTRAGANRFRVIDLQTGAELASMSDTSVSTNLNLHMTPSGKYIVAVEGDSSNNSMYRYNADFTNRVLLTKNTNHFDMNIDSAGNDIVVVLGSLEIIDVGKNSKITVGSGRVDGHVSGGGPPGKFLVTAKLAGNRLVFEIDSADGGAALDNAVIWDDVSDPNAISFRAQKKATMSINGMHAIYTQEFGDGTNRHDEYLVTKTCPAP